MCITFLSACHSTVSVLETFETLTIVPLEYLSWAVGKEKRWRQVGPEGQNSPAFMDGPHMRHSVTLSEVEIGKCKLDLN
jgi:hypothetical protein